MLFSLGAHFVCLVDQSVFPENGFEWRRRHPGELVNTSYHFFVIVLNLLLFLAILRDQPISGLLIIADACVQKELSSLLRGLAKIGE